MTDAITDILQIAFLIAGCLFFAIGTLGLFRFPDTLCRIHGLTKVDNLGLGFIALGLLPSASSIAIGLKILLIWLVVLAASATSAHLVAVAVRSRGEETTARERPYD